jgi:GNAT superfamily N-acetyltransferase
MHEFEIHNVCPAYASALAQLQKDCFPTLGEHERMTEAHFLRHCEIFPEGEFVVLAEEKVVGLGSGFFMDFDFDHPDHTFQEIIAGGYYTNHNLDGEYYYAADISVHPDYRRRGIGRILYEARKDLVRRYNKKGMVGGGVLPGYVRYKGKLTVDEYVDAVVKGQIHDPTLSFQLHNGFVVKGLLENYIEDSASNNWATLIFWPNDQRR